MWLFQYNGVEKQLKIHVVTGNWTQYIRAFPGRGILNALKKIQTYNLIIVLEVECKD